MHYSAPDTCTQLLHLLLLWCRDHGALSDSMEMLWREKDIFESVLKMDRWMIDLVGIKKSDTTRTSRLTLVFCLHPFVCLLNVEEIVFTA